MRATIFTPEVLNGIPELVAQGLNSEAIAARLGCKVTSLRVRCSELKISLRTPRPPKPAAIEPSTMAEYLAAPEPAPIGRPPGRRNRVHGFAMPATLELSRVTRSLLRQRASELGLGEVDLVTKLLEVIAQDDLVAAVLDTKKAA